PHIRSPAAAGPAGVGARTAGPAAVAAAGPTTPRKKCVPAIAAHLDVERLTRRHGIAQPNGERGRHRVAPATRGKTDIPGPTRAANGPNQHLGNARRRYDAGGLTDCRVRAATWQGRAGLRRPCGG